MTDDAPTQEPMPIFEPVPAPEIYVDGYISSAFVSGMVKFTFYSVIHDLRSAKHVQKIVLRLTCPLDRVAEIHEAMGQFLDRLRSQMMAEEDKQ